MKLLLLLFLLLITMPLFAQKSSKLNLDLYLEMQENPRQNYAKILVPALVKGDLSLIQQIVEAGNGHYKYGIKDIASVRISLETVELLLAQASVKRIEHRKVIAHNLYEEDSVMLLNNNALGIHNGIGKLPYGFQGQGVLLGILDDGFEWQHPDFRNSDSTTRILHLWDQVSSDIAYLEPFYEYGASWDSSDINSYHCSHAVGGHGSHVLGTAAGNARASGKYMGIAPKADLACVKVVSNQHFLSGFVDGVHYLFEKAAALGKPCPINSSVGSYSGGHDGKDLYAQLIDNMLTAQSGRALIQAAGNARQYNFHVGGNLHGEIKKTWFEWHSNAQRTHFTLYADTSNFKNINFSLQLINPTTGQPSLQTAIFNTAQFNFTGSIATYSQLLFNDINGNPVSLNIYIDQYEDAYEIYFSISSMIDVGDWQLTTMGTGKYDIWSDNLHLGTSNIVQNVAVPNYLSADNQQSIVGFWTCSEKVITVGSYQNRSTMVNWRGDTIFIGTITYPKYGISHFSSLGPSRTGVQKPNITAPGGQVLSAAPLATLSNLKASNSILLDQDGWHVPNRGTSMAAPMVTGAVALYLQCKPYADYAMILQALQANSRLDSFVFRETVALPNVHWGYGKLDVYKLLESCLILGCTDTLAMNYNAFATVFDSSCIYNVTKLKRIEEVGILTCQPNPFSSNTIINYKLPNSIFNFANLKIYNNIGQVVFEQEVRQTEGQLLFQKAELAAGVYWLVLESDGKKIAHQQLLLTK